MDGKTAHCKKSPLCSKCCELKPYLQFRLCKNKCLKCNECGYFWGPDHKTLEGQHAVFGIYK